MTYFKKVLPAVLAVTLCANTLYAQTPNVNLPQEYNLQQKLGEKIYSTDSRMHTAMHSYYSDDVRLQGAYDSIMNYGVETTVKHTWLRRILTDEHLIQVNKPDFTFYGDFLPDFQAGKDLSGAKTGTWLNTRGFQFGGTVGSKFSFYTNGFENQGKFAQYYRRYIDSNRVVPGQFFKSIDSVSGKADWAYVSALLSYTPIKYLNIALGYDKNFIGDGYRSILLSDVSSNYSFLRLRGTLGNVSLQAIYAYMLDPGAPRLVDANDRTLGDRGKWSAIHYLDWNVNNRLSLGFFEAVTWANRVEAGARGFDVNYIHPLIFIRPVENVNTKSPDKMRIGFTSKYKVWNGAAVYGQFMFDEFTAKEVFAGKGYWANKWAWQLGFRGSNAFGVRNLNYLAEFNGARPYTYSHFQRITNWAGYNQPLAHIMGANFREFIGLANYSWRRFDFQGKVQAAMYGKDPAGSNYGGDIFKPYTTRSVEYGSEIGNGIKTHLYGLEGTVAYMINPKYNLRLEMSGLYRRESNSAGRESTAWLSFGLRSSFRNLYRDF